MADYNQYGDNQGRWDQQYSGDIPHTTYIDQRGLTSVATNAGPPYTYPPTGSASHEYAGPPGSYMPGPSNLAPQPWDMGPFQNTPWTASSLPPTSYSMISSNLSDNPIMDNPFPSTTTAGLLDISALMHSLPFVEQQHQDFEEHGYNQPSVAGPSEPPSQLRCDVCNETFANQKNWDRHLLAEKHLNNIEDDPNVPKYRCACTYAAARKDNYRRHLKNCLFRIDYAYICTCGDWTQNKAHHEEHIDQCGRKRRAKGHK
ncbi:hypothetical protein QBC41DRAFT_304820 [Cercophora samala]|uniref:C2H2-type domain-containing protein n=1 Tax=Cercophora samala TaxID=330535 RepID=A0AA39ZAZ5_9PEZI|nr:hypothetical protein QBC41DRAFT_304820 [Cercophora samala]